MSWADSRLAIFIQAGIAMLGLLTIGAGAEHPFHSGNHWLQVCRGSYDTTAPKEGEAACLGFVSGVEAINTLLPQRYFCNPEGATLGQMTSIVKKYLIDHPQELHEDFGVLVIRALQKAFPC